MQINEPVGVIGVVCPEQAPLLAFCSLVGAAVVRGNAVVAVPSEKGALVATDLYQVLETSDLPAGVINIVTGEADAMAKTLSEHQHVDAVWYHGASGGLLWLGMVTLHCSRNQFLPPPSLLRSPPACSPLAYPTPLHPSPSPSTPTHPSPPAPTPTPTPTLTPTPTPTPLHPIAVAGRRGAVGSMHVEKLSAGNMKRTFVSHGTDRDWAADEQGAGAELLREATEVKNIWVPFGV